MARKDNINAAARKAGQTVGRKSKISSDLIKAGTALGKKTATKSARPQSKAPQVASYKEYLDYTPQQVSRLKKDELRAVVARLNKVEGKRIKNLEKYGFNTQAIRGIYDTGGKTKASRDMTRQELLHEYKRAKAFLTSETSTVKGSQKFVKGIQQMVGATEPLSTDDVNRMYSLLDKYKESGAIGFYKKGDKKSAGYVQSQATQKDIYEMMKQGMSDDDIMIHLGVMSRSDYEARQDTSENFNWDGYHHP